MLEELRIGALGVIDEAVLPLGPGLTVVTGETGAGKTMVVTGLLLLFGGRADSARVRSGVDQAAVEGRLIIRDPAVVERVRQAGGEVDANVDGADTGPDPGGELVLRRTVGANGRSRAYVGGVAAPVAVLGELAERLVAVHGQADQARLTKRAEQLAALDRFAGIDIAGYREAFEAWRSAAAALAERRARAGELRREADLLSHGIAEIDAAEPRPGEDAELTALAARLAHADALRLAARVGHDALTGDADDPTAEAPNVLGLLGTARHAMDQQAGADAQLDALAARVAELATLAVDVAAELRDYVDTLDVDPERLAAIEERRRILRDLIRKYGDDEASVDAVLSWAERARARLADLDVSDEAIAELTERRDAAATRVLQLADEITVARQKAADVLAEAISGELAGLAMSGAEVQIEVNPRGSGSGALELAGRHVGLDGGDDVEFLLRPHPSSPALPIAKGASGGELSRVMLALEVCLAGTDPVPTMVFDEVDAGVGGRAAVEVGRRLARLARAHQVIVVTHLAQVAAYADRHIVVDRVPDRGGKDAADGVTASDVRVVAGADRVAELARMLAGSDSATAREHAAELLATAEQDAAAASATSHNHGGGPATKRTRNKAAKTSR